MSTNGSLEKWIIVTMLSLWSTVAMAQPKVPCYFIFGDSLVDAGNNNFEPSLAQADYVPYGVDFGDSRMPSGRFCNGKTTVDILAELLGMDYIPASDHVVNEKQLLGGVNFASAAAGIRDESGRLLGLRTSMNGQVSNFVKTVAQIETIMGDKITAINHINKCLFTVGLGSNDFVNNYLVPFIYPETQFYSPEEYGKVLRDEYLKQILTLHANGAKKVAIIGPGPVGCSPNALSTQSVDGETCVERFNSAIRNFTELLKPMVTDLNRRFTDANFTYINGYSIFEDILKNAASLGFTDATNACCGWGNNQGLVTCLPLQFPCNDRSSHVFWDAFHPTEAANKIIAKRSFNAQMTTDAYPFDIGELVAI